MEYTKDFIARVRYDEVNNRIYVQNKSREKKLLNKMKKHKIVTISIILFLILLMIDGILLFQFINLLERV